ncbi:MAG TPA: NAD-dependent epimerase [Spirochaetota bacterium]|nr:NAD-dependent epimerase [Spirochaetota bacterium]OPZ37710.1 MAG: dTDP-L-rhamnose 4-epimerase [Spirochaetes bacterium ADurb.BinA120]HNU92100.1 NAD-dependent epimerase [Spirochaetota bacterium]HPI14321.1 NAD-dependent epimerase [Spirochaetota bacterium]
MRILVTGSAGFIGSFTAARLMEDGHEVVGVDNLNDYYDVGLKNDRNERLKSLFPSYAFERMSIADYGALDGLFRSSGFEYVINLAAQAGVRYSITNPLTYGESNLSGFLNVLECCRRHGVRHLVFASSSSVYGLNARVPFSVHDNVDHPVSLYAATKKSNELLAHCYAHLYGIPTTGLRFFTVYGPWGRPDMAYFLFTRAILEGRPIDVFNNGDMERDFTYIDDIVEGVCRTLWRVPSADPAWSAESPDPATSSAPYRIYNIGNNNPVRLTRFIKVIEEALGRKAKINLLPMQPGDVKRTCADIDDLVRDAGYAPATALEKGIGEFVRWYKEYYRIDV